MQVGDETATLSAGLIPAPCSDELLTVFDYITAVQKRKDRHRIVISPYENLAQSRKGLKIYPIAAWRDVQ